MISGKNVYILGAGASADAGGPLMDEFIEKARRLYINPGVLNDYEKEKFKNALNFRDRFRRANDVVNFDFEHLEHTFSLIDMAGELGFPEAEKARDDFIFLIYRTLEKAIKIQLDDPSNPVKTYSTLAVSYTHLTLPTN